MTTDNFWTDEKVKEFLSTFPFPPSANFSIFLDRNMEAFKASNTSTKEEVGWEIECIQHGNRNYWRGKGGKYTNQPFDAGLSSEWLLKNGGVIFRVTRKSDGIVFSLGDSVDIRIGAFNPSGWQRHTADISKIMIVHGEVFLECGSCSGSLKEAIPLKQYKSEPKRTKLFTDSQRISDLQDRVDYIEKKLNIEG